MSQLASLVQRSAGRFGIVLPLSFLAFLGVGVTGLAVNLLILEFLERIAHVPFALALAVSLVIATFVTWALNRRMTFAASGRKAHHEALRYFAVAGVAQGVNYGVSLGIAALLPVLPHVIDAMIGAVVATLFSYTGQRFFTFAPAKADTLKSNPKV
jgi:putative flippase GtrA